MTTNAIARGFAAPCIHCGESGGVYLSLADLDTFHCQECSEDFGLDDVRRWLRQWAAVVKWIEAAPPADEA